MMASNFHAEVEKVCQQFDDRIVQMVLHTSMTYTQIAESVGLETKYVGRLVKRLGISRARGAGSPAHKNYKRP